MNQTKQAERKTQKSCRDASYQVKRKGWSKKKGEKAGVLHVFSTDVDADQQLVFIFAGRVIW